MKRDSADDLQGSQKDSGSGRAPFESVSAGTVRGERSVPSVSTSRSLQSRASSIMACALMIVIGVGMLTWYYSNALSRKTRSARDAQIVSVRHSQGEMPLPALGGFNQVSGKDTRQHARLKICGRSRSTRRTRRGLPAGVE